MAQVLKYVGTYQPSIPEWRGVVFTAETGWPNRIIVFTNGIDIMGAWRVSGWTKERAIFNLIPFFSSARPPEPIGWYQWASASRYNMTVFRWAQANGYTMT